MEGGEDRFLTEVFPGEPTDLSRVSSIAVGVRILSEERVGALRAGEPAHATQRRQVEPRVVLPICVEVAGTGEANALQVKRLQDRME